MTFSKLKAAALAIGCVLALQGCGEAVEADDPGEAVEADDPRDVWTSGSEEFNEYMTKLNAEHREDMRQFAKVVILFNDRRCDEALEQLEAAGADETRLIARVEFGTYQALLYFEGLCVPRDPERAAKMLSDVIDRDEAPEAMARLGALYLQGDGVEQDTELANKLFRRAVFSHIESRLRPNPSPNGIGHHEPFGEIWNMSELDMRHEFVSYLTGPWQLPTPLRAEMEWLEKIRAGGGEVIFETSEKFKTGTDEFEQDEKLAFIMLEIAADDYDYIPAQYPYAMALRDDELCPKRSPRCERQHRETDFSMSLYPTFIAARHDDVRAQQFLVDKLQQQKLPDHATEEERTLLSQVYYYWLLRLNVNREQSEDRLAEAALALPSDDRAWIEEMVEEKDPFGLLYGIRNYPATIEELPPNQTP